MCQLPEGEVRGMWQAAGAGGRVTGRDEGWRSPGLGSVNDSRGRMEDGRGEKRFSDLQKQFECWLWTKDVTEVFSPHRYIADSCI